MLVRRWPPCVRTEGATHLIDGQQVTDVRLQSHQVIQPLGARMHLGGRGGCVDHRLAGKPGIGLTICANYRRARHSPAHPGTQRKKYGGLAAHGLK